MWELTHNLVCRYPLQKQSVQIDFEIVLRKQEQWIDEFKDSIRLVDVLWSSFNGSAFLSEKVSEQEVKLAETVNRYIHILATKIRHDRLTAGGEDDLNDVSNSNSLGAEIWNAIAQDLGEKSGLRVPCSQDSIIIQMSEGGADRTSVTLYRGETDGSFQDGTGEASSLRSTNKPGTIKSKL